MAEKVLFGEKSTYVEKSLYVRTHVRNCNVFHMMKNRYTWKNDIRKLIIC